MAGEIARILVEFLEVAITSIVFLKGVYLPVSFSLNPSVCVCVCVCARVRACVRARARACVRAHACARVRAYKPYMHQNSRKVCVCVPINLICIKTGGKERKEEVHF